MGRQLRSSSKRGGALSKSSKEPFAALAQQVTHDKRIPRSVTRAYKSVGSGRVLGLGCRDLGFQGLVTTVIYKLRRSSLGTAPTQQQSILGVLLRAIDSHGISIRRGCPASGRSDPFKNPLYSPLQTRLSLATPPPSLPWWMA